MLIGITGTHGSGRKTAMKYLESHGYLRIENDHDVFESIVSRWQENFVTLIQGSPGEVRKRPWFLHLNIEATDSVRFRRLSVAPADDADKSDEAVTDRVSNIRNSHINVINDSSTLTEFIAELDRLNLENLERVRPSWDQYFMTLADLAARRSNCMKRRVGCVLVHENRIVATGYNGTPRGLKNCSEGGCPRCNSGSKGGTSLSTCLCLHAEENALLEAGRSRITGSIIYCNTCPCLTCSIKIVQTGVSEVVYSQDYSMDKESATVLESGGVRLRKYISM